MLRLSNWQTKTIIGILLPVVSFWDPAVASPLMGCDQAFCLVATFKNDLS